MIYGSHNTMSFLPVKQWWLRPFRAWGRCQRLSLAEQWEAGVRYFDMRIKFDSKGRANFGHGLISYRCEESPAEVIKALANRARTEKQKVTLRIWLEQRASAKRRAQFAAWLADNDIMTRLNEAGVNSRIGHKHTGADIYPDLTGRVVEVCKHYDKRWHFVIPPCGWLWEQRRMVEAVTATGYEGIISEDFVEKK